MEKYDIRVFEYSFHIYEKNNMKIFRSLNSVALIDQTKA